MPQPLEDFWSSDRAAVLAALGTTDGGLTAADVATRLATYGPNTLGPPSGTGTLQLLLGQFKSPIVLLLLGAAILSAFLKDPVDAGLILAIVVASGLLGFWQERGAADAVKGLLDKVAVRADVLRDDAYVAVPTAEVVPGDVVSLSAGDTLPGDCRLLSARDLFVDESALTGETFPAEKDPDAQVAADAPLARRVTAAFMGTHVVSGQAVALVVRTGTATEFGAVSQRLRLRPAETEFEHGVRRFGILLMEVTMVLVVTIFGINVYLHRPVLDSFLFAMALAVGLTPQLLPAIISINLAHGAAQMAKHRVIVKQLTSIENLGSMNVLCSDKTGTLTRGLVEVQSAVGVEGRPSERVMRYAYLNSLLETGFRNPIDEAIRASAPFDASGWRKLDEEPYDFVRKRISILAEDDSERLMITKGAVAGVLSVCDRCVLEDGTVVPLDGESAAVRALAGTFAERGSRTLAVAYRDEVGVTRIGKPDETGMIFAGLLALFDPPKEGAADAVAELKRLGVQLKLITGDAAPVARTLGTHMGLAEPQILTGSELHALSDSALTARSSHVDIFAEIEPNQKERIVVALRKAGNVVGYMGDGINDASALHAADVGLSVDSAVDVAKEAAQVVLLAPGLDVLAAGVRSGRETFANTLKYAFMATSANFGNMFSMAGASLFLKFLPLLPTQILLTNILTDVPEMTISTDSVDPELTERPRRWDLRFMRDFMVTFGLLSSVFDYLTFGVLLVLLKASPAEFRTGWFVESVLSASMVVLIIRTRRPFLKSRPSTRLALATGGIAVATVALPYTPLGPLFQFTRLPPAFYPALGVVLVIYVLSAEAVKALFYRHHP